MALTAALAETPATTAVNLKATEHLTETLAPVMAGVPVITRWRTRTLVPATHRIPGITERLTPILAMEIILDSAIMVDLMVDPEVIGNS